MKKYNDEEYTMSRAKRNSSIYSSIDMDGLSRISTNTNVSVISEAPKQIDLEKIKKYVYAKSNEDNESNKRIKLDLPSEEQIIVEREEPKEYDINAVLERAKETKESNYESMRYKKLSNHEYDILNKINTKLEVDPDITESIEELNTQEKTIVNLINDISKTKTQKKEELFSELLGDDENTIVMAPITNEINTSNIRKELDDITRELNDLKRPLEGLKEETTCDNFNTTPPTIEKIDASENKKVSDIDKSFFTNSLSFSKKDFVGKSNESYDSDETDYDTEKGSSFYSKFAIVMIILVLAATIVIVANYLFDLGWF